MSEVELQVLVRNYATIKSICKPAHTLLLHAQHSLSWGNPQLTVCSLALLTIFLLYPLYLQFTLLTTIMGIFAVSYLGSNSRSQEEDSRANVFDPVNFINPIYYSLEPDTSAKSRDKTIQEYKQMLKEIDVLLKELLQIREKAVALVSWSNFNQTRNAVIVSGFLLLAPSVVPLNFLFLGLVLYFSCCNRKCCNSLKKLLTDLDPYRTAPPIVEYSESRTQDSDEDEFADSISEQTHGQTHRQTHGQTHGQTEESHDQSIVETDGFSATSHNRPCTNCSNTSRGQVMCAFCGCCYCAACCQNTVTKAQLGVTNPDTKHSLVRVCAECALDLPSSK